MHGKSTTIRFSTCPIPEQPTGITQDPVRVFVDREDEITI